VNPLLVAKLLGWVARVPWWAWALVILLGWGLAQGHRASAARAEYAAAQAQAAKEQAEAAAKAQAETDRRTRAIMEAADAATIQSQADRAAAGRARAAVDRLRAAVAAHAPDAGASGPAAAPGGTSAPGTAVLSADLLGRCGERVVELAGFADAARTAGAACERAYQALTAPK
jgi:hypothetical protein